MKVHHAMSRDVVKAKTKTPFRELWQAIFQKHIHAIPVVDEKDRLIGIISEEDLIKPLYANYSEFITDFVSASNFEEMEEKLEGLTGLTASDIMCAKVIFTREETPLLRALSRMMLRNVRQLPVLSEEDIVIGMISKGDIFDHLFREKLLHKKRS